LNAKNLMINHEKKGTVKLGSLSHNELCRGTASLMQEVQNGKILLNRVYYQYANHIASLEALSKDERMMLDVLT